MTTDTSAVNALADLADRAFADDADNPLSETHALVVSHHGEIVFERYADGFDATSTFLSWSMAKSFVSALCGVLVDQGQLELDAPAAVPAWRDRDDPRRAITLRNLLQMRDGLSWNEDYVDDQVSDVIEMLFGSGQADVAGYAIARELAVEPDTRFLYSSGTTNIISRILTDAIGGGVEGFTAAMVDRLLVPAGMKNATIKFDEAGTFVGSSFLYATARDYVAFGELFRNGGVAASGTGGRLLSEQWVQSSITSASTCPETGQGYGFQWWLPLDDHTSYAASGYEGQRLQIANDLGLTFARLGKTDATFSDDLLGFYRDVTNCFVPARG
jgi:CubicO group peptidase (beta-lactamase class C family)